MNIYWVRAMVFAKVLLPACILSLSGCDTPLYDSKADVYFESDAKIFALSADLREVPKLDLPRAGFSIISPLINDDVAIQLCASNDDNIFSTLALGDAIDSHPCFDLGTGMAMDAAPTVKRSVPMFISGGAAHNYYAEERRIKSNNHITVNVNKVIADSDGSYDNTCILIVIDKNKNNRIDEQELWAAKVRWH